MKKIVSSILAAIVTVAFAGIVCAAEPAADTAAPAMPAGHPAVKAEKKVKKVKKAKKAKKAAAKKEEVKPAEAPAAK